MGSGPFAPPRPTNSAPEPTPPDPLARVALTTAGADGVAPPDAAELAGRVASGGLARRTFYSDGMSLLELLNRVPPDRQAAIAATAFDHADPTDRPVWPWQVVADADRPLPDSVADVVVRVATEPVRIATVDAPAGHDATRRPIPVPVDGS